MASVYLHSGIISSPKHAPLSDGAFRLWTHALCWSKEHLTDGYIPMGMLPSLHLQAKKYVPELLHVLVPGKSPLWEKDGDGYRIHDFGDWQDTAAVVQTRRQKWRASKRKDSKVESTPESKGDSKGDSRQGLVRGNVNVNEGGNGEGINGADAPRPTRPANTGIEVPPQQPQQGAQPPAGATNGPSRIAVVPPRTAPVPNRAYLDVIEAWNVEARRTPGWVEVSAHLDDLARRRINAALRALPDIGAWEARFARAAASDHLTNRNGKGFVADFWWLLDHLAELDAGRYDERERVASIGSLKKISSHDHNLAILAALRAGTNG